MFPGSSVVRDFPSYTGAGLPLSPAVANLRTRIVAGRQEILARLPLLIALSERCGQVGAMNHLEYFLNFETSLKKIPYLILLGDNLHRAEVDENEATAALLVYEYRVLGRRTGIFATDDTSGRRTLVAPEPLRARALDLACTAVMRAGAQLVLMSVRLDPSTGEAQPVAPIPVNGAWWYASRDREIPSYLPIESTMEATLATMGQSTRRNLRRYRQRTERDLGCSFVEAVEMTRAEFQTFNRECSFAVSDEQAAGRYDAVTKGEGMFLCGIKDGAGRWLSMLGGRRYNDVAELDWQMNRDAMPLYSLSTVMRSYYIEYAIGQRIRRLFFEGGTPHAMRFTFTTDLVRDVSLVKRTLRAWMMRKLAVRLLPEKNFVREVLLDETVLWAALRSQQ